MTALLCRLGVHVRCRTRWTNRRGRDIFECFS